MKKQEAKKRLTEKVKELKLLEKQYIESIQALSSELKNKDEFASKVMSIMNAYQKKTAEVENEIDGLRFIINPPARRILR